MANPLDRTWFNTLIDDDGSGTTGTVWNKAQVDGLLDTVDASLAGIIDKSGFTPAANQLAIFNDADTIKGETNLVFNGTTLIIPQGQIQFPATPNPSADATTLDDYREGTWTPSFSATGGLSGQTYAVQEGSYIKIGRRVYGVGQIKLSTLGTMAGVVGIVLPPFLSAGGGIVGEIRISWWQGMATALVYMAGYVPGNSNVGHMTVAPGAATGVSYATPAYFGNASELYFSVKYLSAS